MQTQQRNRRRRISRWSRRILKRFPPCPQNAQCGFFVRGPVRRSARSPTARIKESAIHRIEELRHHRVADRPRKSEVAQHRRRLVSVKTSNHRESIVIEHARDSDRGSATVFALLHPRIRVSNHMLHPALRIPSLGEQPIERAQSKVARLRQIQHLGRFQISRHAHRVPARIDRLVHIRCWTQQTRRIHLLLGRGQQRARPFFRNVQPPRNFLHRVSNSKAHSSPDCDACPRLR